MILSVLPKVIESSEELNDWKFYSTVH